MQYQEVPSLEHSLYGEFYRRYASGLFAYAYQQTASREDAEDIVLDVFLSVLQDKQFLAFDEQKQVRWLWTITRNKIVDHYRHSARRPHVSIEWLTEPLYEDGSREPEEVSLKQEEYAQLYNALHTLPKLQQEVLRLRFGHGLKCDEIAPVLEKSEGAVRMMLFRALQYLRGIDKNREKGGQA
jgi:RNA polymerase sigma-70 factor, ECF subfamily